MKVYAGGRVMYGCLRPLSGSLQVERYGTVVQDVKRLLLPRGCCIRPGERIETDDGPYVCIAVRFLPGHVQADIRRCQK